MARRSALERAKVIKVTRRWHGLGETEVELPRLVPNVVFRTRVRDESVGGPNPFRWEDVTTWDLFAGKRVVLFALPGAFTPTCSEKQLPGYEAMYNDFRWNGIDEIFCLSVNDAFVMNCWAKQQGIQNVKMIPDGAAKFTSAVNMVVSKDNLGFGVRSWRYAMIIENGRIVKWFIEPDPRDEAEDDSYGESSPENVLAWIKEQNANVSEEDPNKAPF